MCVIVHMAHYIKQFIDLLAYRIRFRTSPTTSFQAENTHTYMYVYVYCRCMCVCVYASTTSAQTSLFNISASIAVITAYVNAAFTVQRQDQQLLKASNHFAVA